MEITATKNHTDVTRHAARRHRLHESVIDAVRARALRKCSVW
jgi:hypothetical protein